MPPTLGLVAIVFIFAPAWLIGFFTTDATVTEYAVDCLRTIGYGNLAYAFGMVMVQAFNGAGDTVTPTIINIIGFWLCEIPLAWALAFPGAWVCVESSMRFRSRISDHHHGRHHVPARIVETPAGFDESDVFNHSRDVGL